MNLGKVGIIFGPGGFAGAFSAGYAKAIWGRKITPQYVQGVSVGALNAAEIIESGSAEELIKVWLNIEKARASSVFDWKNIPKRVLWMRANSLFENNGILKIINGMDMRKIINSPIELQIVTLNESKNNEPTIFSNRQKEFSENPELFKRAILASTAIPGFIPPVEIEGEIHSDGILFDLEAMIKIGCDTIFILLNDQCDRNQRWDQRLSQPKNFLYEKVIEFEIKEILTKYPDFEIFENDGSGGENEFLPPVIRKIRKVVQKIKGATGSFVRGDSVNLVPHRIIPLNIRTPISTLHTIGYEIGDIKAAIEQGYDIASALLDKLLPSS